MTGRFQRFLTLVLLTSLTGIVLVNLVWDLQLTRAMLLRQTAWLLSMEAEKRSQELDDMWNEYRAFIHKIGNEFGEYFLGNDFMEARANDPNLLVDQVKKHDFVERVQIAGPEGYVVADSQRTSTNEYVILPRDEGFSWEVPYVSDVRVAQTGQNYMFQMILPLKRGVDHIIGYVAVNYFFDKKTFPVMDEGPSFGDTGEAYLIDGKGMALTPLRFRYDSVLNQRVNIPAKALGPRQNGSPDMYVYHNYFGKSVMGVVRHLPNFGWFIVGEMQTGEIYSGAKRMFFWIFGVHLFFLIVLGAIVFVFVRRSLAPLRTLQFGLRNILQGRWEFRFDKIEDNEIGEIAAALNALMDNVQAALDNTEERIQKSTAAMKERLTQYEAQNELLNDIRRASLNLMEDLDEERQKIESNEEKIRTIIASAMDAIIVVGANGMIDTFNPAAERMFGYKAKEMISSPINKLWPEDGREGNELIQKVLSQYNYEPGYYQSTEITGFSKDKRSIPLEISLGTMRIAQMSWVVVILRDVTERKQFEEELLRQKTNLEKVNMELDGFVYMASHDLRAPLRGISAFASFLETDCASRLDDTGKEYITEIKKGAMRLGELIDDLLNLSRMSRMKNPFEEVDIVALIDQVKKRMEYDLKHHDARLEIKGSIPVIHCDRIKIAEVFLNLIGNAVKFSSKIPGQSPYVEIGYTDRGDEHEIYVRDNGIGIDSKYHQKIFGIFKRLHTMEEYDGTGAGLSIVERIILDHGGKVWVESELGKGATFLFRIPKRQVECLQG